MLSPVLEQLEEDYGEWLRVIFREFPLARHKHAMDAARAAEAAGLQGRFWEMDDMLYQNRFIRLTSPRFSMITAQTLKTRYRTLWLLLAQAFVLHALLQLLPFISRTHVLAYRGALCRLPFSSRRLAKK